LIGHHNRCLKGEDVIIGRHGGSGTIAKMTRPREDYCLHFFLFDVLKKGNLIID
jgi:hypothetical protein